MKAKDVHKLSDEEVEVELKRLRSRSFELRTQAVTEKIEDTSQFIKTRCDVARLLTERSARRRAVEREQRITRGRDAERLTPPGRMPGHTEGAELRSAPEAQSGGRMSSD